MFDHRVPLSLRYAGSSSESSNIVDVLDELRGIPERDRKVESSLMPASQSSLTSWRSTYCCEGGDDAGRATSEYHSN